MVVTGTGTEVGKTWISCELASNLRSRGLAVAARKPVQSFDPNGGPTDADLLAAATGVPTSDVCPPLRSYELPLAPPIAAASLGRPEVTLSQMVDSLDWPPGTDVGLVEGAGGPRSPLAADGDTVDLIESLAPEMVVLVADAGLGTINATRLSVAALGSAKVAVVLNRYDGSSSLHAANLVWLRDRCGFDVLTGVAALAERLLG